MNINLPAKYIIERLGNPSVRLSGWSFDGFPQFLKEVQNNALI